MTTILLFRPIRTLRSNLAHIGAAVNASRELTQAVDARQASGPPRCNPATAAIPL